MRKTFLAEITAGFILAAALATIIYLITIGVSWYNDRTQDRLDDYRYGNPARGQ